MKEAVIKMPGYGAHEDKHLWFLCTNLEAEKEANNFEFEICRDLKLVVSSFALYHDDLAYFNFVEFIDKYECLPSNIENDMLDELEKNYNYLKFFLFKCLIEAPRNNTSFSDKFKNILELLKDKLGIFVVVSSNDDGLLPSIRVIKSRNTEYKLDDPKSMIFEIHETYHMEEEQ